MSLERRRRIRAQARRAFGASLLLPALALTIAACGSSSSLGKGTDPATLVPASAPVFVGAEVRPGEPLVSSARAAAQALTHQANPYLQLLGALQTPGSPKLDYARDVRPWLGRDAGVFLGTLRGKSSAGVGDLLTLLERALAGDATSASEFPFSSSGVDGAMLLDTTDSSKAQAFLGSQAARAGAHASAYRGVAYKVSGQGIAFGLVKRVAVIGSEAALHSVVDTSLGGSALAGEATYAKLAAARPSGALANLYVNPDEAGGARLPRASGSEANLLTVLTGLDGGRALDVSFIPSRSAIALDLDTPASGSQSASGGLLPAAAAGAGALGELPAESWLGIGLGGSGSALGANVRGLRSVLSLLSSGAGSSNAVVSVKGLLDGFLAPLDVLGAETAAARRDYQDWMTSAALFAAGTGLLSIKGGVVILSADPARSRAAVGKLAAALRRSGIQVGAVTVPGTDAAVSARVATLPLPLVIADGHDAAGKTKFVIGLGEGSVTAALGAKSTLAGGPTLSAAADSLGEGIQPSATIDFPTLLGLLEAAGLTEDPTIAPLVGYARSLTTLSAGGSRPASGVERLRVTAGLRQPEPGA